MLWTIPRGPIMRASATIFSSSVLKTASFLLSETL
jgi:hypothetical protein